MKKIMWAVSCIALIGTAAALQYMPEVVPLHYDLAGNIDRWGSKYEYLLLAFIIMLLTLFMAFLMGYYEKKAMRAADGKESAGAASNARVIGIAGVSMAVVLTVLQGFLLYGAYNEAVSGAAKQTVDIGKITAVLMGVLFIVLGNSMTKTRINHTVGLRIKWSMYNDQTWRKSNRFGALAMIISGVLTILAALLMKNSFAATMVSLGFVSLALIAAVVYAHKVYMQEVEAEKGKK